MTKFAPSYIYHAQAHHLILLNKQQNYILFCDIILQCNVSKIRSNNKRSRLDIIFKYLIKISVKNGKWKTGKRLSGYLSFVFLSKHFIFSLLVFSMISNPLNDFFNFSPVFTNQLVISITVSWSLNPWILFVSAAVGNWSLT